jgi:sugar lactone lactonase YvrE
VDASGNVFVADQEHHRVLMYTDPITNGKAASVVFGQMNFASANMVITPTAASLLSPGGVTLDSSGNLYVADTQTNRVLRYTAPFTNSMNADLVLGQTDFFTDTGETDVTASSLFMPSGLFADSQPTPSLYVADRDNNRVLRYTAPFTNGMNANLVYGQADDFTTDYTNNNLNLATSRGLWSPNAIVVGGNGSIYIVDNGNNRVLAYDATSSPCGIFVYLPVIRK